MEGHKRREMKRHVRVGGTKEETRTVNKGVVELRKEQHDGSDREVVEGNHGFHATRAVVWLHLYRIVMGC